MFQQWAALFTLQLVSNAWESQSHVCSAMTRHHWSLQCELECKVLTREFRDHRALTCHGASACSRGLWRGQAGWGWRSLLLSGPLPASAQGHGYSRTRRRSWGQKNTEMLAVLHRTEQTVDGSYSCGFHGRALKSTTSQVENTFQFYYYVMILFSCRYMVKLL